MGKITVKHYLEKRVKEIEWRKVNPKFKPLPEGENSDLFLYFDEPRTVYPIYIQITINRKTTRLSSFTKYRLTESEFLDYQNTGSFEFEHDGKRLRTELDRVYRILEYFINIKKIDYSIYDIKTILAFYGRSIDTEFYQWAYIDGLRTSFERTEKLKPLRNYIYWKINPRELINYFKQTFDFDFEPLLEQSELELINAFDCFIQSLPQIKTLYEKPVLIDWYNGTAKTNFNRYMIKNKIDIQTRDKYLQRITDFSEAIGDLFLTVVKDKQPIESYDKM